MNDAEEMYSVVLAASDAFSESWLGGVTRPNQVAFVFGVALGLRIGIDHADAGSALLYRLEGAVPSLGEEMEVMVRNLADAVVG